MFYDGLSIKIKEMMVSQDWDHTGVADHNAVATKALAIESRLEAFKNQNKASSGSKADSSSKGKSLTASTGAPGKKLTVGDYVYVVRDGKAVKGKIISAGKNAKGKDAPTVQ